MMIPKVLIVEDEALIALELALAAEELGAVVLGPVSCVSDAIALLNEFEVDGAVIDAQLLDRDVTPVACALTELGVPFVVFTGTGLPTELATMLPDTPVIMKPTRADQVVKTVLTRIENGIKAQ